MHLFLVVSCICFVVQLPPTSSILGPPPSKYPPNFPPPQGGTGCCSILGNAPPLPGGGGAGPPYNAGGHGGGGGTGGSQQIISPPVFPGQPAPPPQPSLQQQPQMPPPPHPMNQTTPPCSSSQAHQGVPPPPLQPNQSSILGQPPTPPLNPHHMYPHPPQPGGPQNFHNVPPRPHGGHGQPPINQPIPLYGHQLESNHPPPPQTVTGLITHATAPPFGLNMIPFQSSVPMPSANGPQPGLNFARQPMQAVGTSMKDAFTIGLDRGSVGVMPPPPPPVPVGQANNHPTSQYVTLTSDFNKFGFPAHHYADKIPDDIHLGMGGGGGQTMLLPPAPHGSNPQTVLGVDTGGGTEPLLRRSNMNVVVSHPSDNVFGLSMRQLGGLSVSQVEDLGKAGAVGGGGGGARLISKGVGMEKFPPQGVNMDVFALNPSDNPNNTLTTGSGMLSVGTVVPPSTNYIMMAPGMLSASNENVAPRDSSSFVPSVGGGGAVGSMVPIGTERAQKSTSIPAAAFPGMCACAIYIA